MNKVLLLAGGMLAWSVAVQAAEMPAPSEVVTVSAVRDPVQKSYRKIVKGMDTFEQFRALAPNAGLRYRLLPRIPGTKMEGIVLKIMGDTQTYGVKIDPDNSFTLDRHQDALDQDAQVIPNRKATTMTWRALVKTPGVPEGARRLGDLRLECKVGMAAGLISNRNFFAEMLRTPIPKDCDEEHTGVYLFFADKPLFNVTFQDGARKETISFWDLYAGYKSYKDERLARCDCQALMDRTYFVPLGDRSWSDETIVTFDYMDTPTLAPVASYRLGAGEVPVTLGVTTGAELAAAAKVRRKVVFDNGYESWLFERDPAVAPTSRTDLRRAEVTFLIDPAGVVRKASQREPTILQAKAGR